MKCSYSLYRLYVNVIEHCRKKRCSNNRRLFNNPRENNAYDDIICDCLIHILMWHFLELIQFFYSELQVSANTLFIMEEMEWLLIIDACIMLCEHLWKSGFYEIFKISADNVWSGSVCPIPNFVVIGQTFTEISQFLNYLWMSEWCYHVHHVPFVASQLTKASLAECRRRRPRKSLTMPEWWQSRSRWQKYSYVLLHSLSDACYYYYYKKASIRWQDSARRQFQAGLRGDVGL